jgi:hypothetical protein
MVHLEWQEDANLVKYLSVLLQLSRKRYGGAIRARRFSELKSNPRGRGNQMHLLIVSLAASP